MDGIFRTLHTNKLAISTFSACAVIGALYVTSKLLGFLRVLFDVYVRRGISLKEFGAGKGGWAVVTGASDGIGKEFSHQLAENKFNILLVSRTQSKLEDLAREIETKYPVKTRIFAMDFTTAGARQYQDLASIIDELKVGVLVNNVAVNYQMPEPFVTTSDDLLENIVNVNVLGTLKVTKMVIPQMITNKTGLILNLGSFAGSVATPYLSVYSAGKAFLSTFSQALGSELESNGIVVEHINTYFVVTAMSKIRRSSWAIPMPRPYVKSVLSKIGVSGGADIPFGSTPYPSHAILDWAFNTLLPKWFLVGQNLAIQKDVRKRALKKREREAEKTKDQ